MRGPISTGKLIINKPGFSMKKVQIYLLSTFVILCFGLYGATSHISWSAASPAQDAPSTAASSAGSPFQAIRVNGGPLLNEGPDYYHWYAGAVFTGSTTNSTQIRSNITVPSGAPPKSNQFYYVILSIWDNTGSYDQIGFTDDNGLWGLAISYTTGFNVTTCSGTLHYHYGADYANLTAGTQYSFSITIKSGTVYLQAYTGSTFVYQIKTHNGATSFSVANSFCGYYDYTVYEEAYMNTATAVPNHNFYWPYSYYQPGKKAPDWSGFKISAPSKVSVVISGPGNDKCLIKN